MTDFEYEFWLLSQENFNYYDINNGVMFILSYFSDFLDANDQHLFTNEDIDYFFEGYSEEEKENISINIETFRSIILKKE